MNIAARPVGREVTSEFEWRTRCDLAALYRLVAHHRWTDFIYTHISARLPGPEHHFLINKFGVNFQEIRASDLVRIDLDGRVVEDSDKTSRDVNVAGFTIHSAIHMARPDLLCVVHTHSSAGIAVSAMRDGLLPLSQHAMKFYNRLGYHDYEGIALNADEKARLVHDLGDNMMMLLRNHGTLTVGRTAADCWTHMFYLERACKQQVMALTVGRSR